MIISTLKKLVGRAHPVDGGGADGVDTVYDLDRLVAQIVGDDPDPETRALGIARWIAENVTNKRPSGSGVKAVAREGRGFCGGRARLFVDLASRAGIEAQLFGLYNRGLRHTAVQAKVGGKWRFIDPMYGAVFRRDCELLSFQDIREAPDEAAQAIEILGGTADTDGVDELGREKPLDHVAKVHSLYAAKHLANADSFGFLYGADPVVHYPVVDLTRQDLPLMIEDSSADGKAFMKSASRTFLTPLPDFIGASNRKVVWSWRFQGAVPGMPLTIELAFKRLPKQPLQLTASSSNADIRYGGETKVGGQRSNNPWRIVLLPRDDAPMVDLNAEFTTWSHVVKIERVIVRDGMSTDDAAQPDWAAAVGRDHYAAPVTERAAAPDPDQLYDYLENCGITKTVRTGTFHKYKKRPGNWAWVYHGTAAIFAFRATGDRRFLRWLAEIFDVMAWSRDSDFDRIDAYRGRAFRSWGAQVKDRNAGGMCWVNEVCTGGTMALPAALFAAEVRQRPDLQGEFAETAERFAAVCQEVADEFEADRRDLADRAESYYIMPHDGAPEPLAHVAPFAAMLSALYRVTGRQNDYDTATRLANYFRSAISKDSDGLWSWPYRPTPEKMHGPGEYFFKARVTLTFPIHASALGLFFDRADLEAFARTVLGAVCREDRCLYTTVSRANGKALAGSEYARFREKGRLGSLAQVIGFYPLAVVEPEIANRLSALLTSYPDLFPKGWFSTPSSVEAYACELGRNEALNV